MTRNWTSYCPIKCDNQINKERNFDYAFGKLSDAGNRGDIISIAGKKETETVIKYGGINRE